MAVSASPPRNTEPWRVIGHTVRGASHVRRNMRNQDCLKSVSEGGQVILALADGHGSAKSFRSDAGSRFAVAVSIEFAAELLKAARLADRQFLSMVQDQLKTHLPKRIVQSWKERVDEDLARNPFTDSELNALTEQDGVESRRRVEQDNRLAYGSTLITAIAMESFAVFWQIGDGDVLTISGDREVSRPIRGDERLIANETTSLCSTDAWRMFRSAVLGKPAPMIMLSTDGFANSFQDDAGFFKFGTDVSDIIATEGLAKVDASLTEWLDEISARGSGDDISLGIVCRPKSLPRRAIIPARQDPPQPPTMVVPAQELSPPPPPPLPPLAPHYTPRPVLDTVIEQPQRVPQELDKTLAQDEPDLPADDETSAGSRGIMQRTLGHLRGNRQKPGKEDKKQYGRHAKGHDRTLPAYQESDKDGNRDN
jgi:serine/threonine protein phosphatase PrpC